MQLIALYSAALIALGLFPVGHYLLFILDRASLVDTAIILAHLSGFPFGALVALFGQAAGVQPAVTWLMTVAAYGLCVGASLALRWAHLRQERGPA